MNYTAAEVKAFQKEQWLKQANAELQRVYAISFRDIGEEPSEFFSRYGDDSPAAAVQAYGEKYGLTSRADFERSFKLKRGV